MDRSKTRPEPFRCHATMPDGSAMVLFGSTSTPEIAVQLVLASSEPDMPKPVKVTIYRGGKTRPVGKPLLQWSAE